MAFVALPVVAFVLLVAFSDSATIPSATSLKLAPSLSAPDFINPQASGIRQSNKSR